VRRILGWWPAGGELKSMRDDEHEPEDGGGFDVDDWSRLTAFTGAVATLDDVQSRRAVFALTDTTDAAVLEIDLPQPLIWWEEDGEQAAVAVQAERHRSAEGETLEVLGLILPDGGSAIALIEDVDFVDDSDPTWRELVERAVDSGDV
jgi:hypothetical protein